LATLFPSAVLDEYFDDIGRDYSKYQADPVGFGEEILGETYTDELKEILCSVRDNEITVARSCNAPGKTFVASTVAIWFKKAFSNSKVYTAAAPPIENLQRLLWGEINSKVQNHPNLFYSDKISNLHIESSPVSFITGVTIPTSGTSAQREARFCVDADELFEMNDGSLVKYCDLVGRTVPVVSVDENFDRKWSFAEFFNNGVEFIYEIEFEDGSSIRRTGTHPLYCGWNIIRDMRTHNGAHVKGRIRVCEEGWRNVAEIKTGMAVLCPEDTGFNFGCKEYNEDLIKFIAYMLGDGFFGGEGQNRLIFTKGECPQKAEFLEILKDIEAKYTISDLDKYSWACIQTTDKRLIDFTKECGLFGKRSESKFIPEFIFGLRKEYVALFLSRLFSTDGWACLTNKAEIGYCSKSKQLIFDVQRLLNRFGIRAKVVSKFVQWDHENEKRSGIYWNVFIWNAFDIIKFYDEIGIYGKEDAINQCYEYSINRKTYANWKFEKHNYRWKKVYSIRALGNAPTVGVHVPGNHTYLTSVVDHNSGKHAPNLLFVLDEGDAIPDEVYKGIESCLSGGGVVRLLVLFNPRAEVGPVYRMERNNTAKVIHLSAFNHPNVITGDDVFPGAVTRSKTIQRIHEWCRPWVEGDKSDQTFELPPYLVGQITKKTSGFEEYPPLKAGKYVIQNPAFSYMVLGEYPAQSSRQLISREWVSLARSRWDAYVAIHGEVPPDGTTAVVGFDVAEDGVDYNVLCFRYGGFVPRLIKWQGLRDILENADKAYVETKSKNVEYVAVDATGIGSGVAPQIRRRGGSSVPVKFANSSKCSVDEGDFRNLRDELYWKLRDWLHRDPGAMLPPDEDLLEEILTIKYDVYNGKIEMMPKSIRKDDERGNNQTMKSLLKRSPDSLEALVCSLYVPELLFPELL